SGAADRGAGLRQLHGDGQIPAARRGDRMSTLPLWADMLVSVLVLAGAAIALVGSFNLVRLANFFERVHAPAVIATLGCWCVMYGTVLYFSLQNHTVAAH